MRAETGCQNLRASVKGARGMRVPFKGVINVDIRDSTPDWAPFEPPRAPDGAPNVLYVVLDDVGFSAMSCYGGPIETPNIDRIVDSGVRYTQFHTTALCSPTRSSLLTGRNHTRNSMACITEAPIGFPNASGTVPPENGMLSEVLGERGWNTYMVGKWHLCPTDEMNLAARGATGRPAAASSAGTASSALRRTSGIPTSSTTTTWPTSRGRRRRATTSPRTSRTRRWSSSEIRRRSLPEKPFFLYDAPGACYAPHHAPKQWIKRFSGRFDQGYEAIREETLARQKELGIVPKDTELPPINPIGTPETRTGPAGQPFPELDYTRPWDSLNDDEKRLFCRIAFHAIRHSGRGCRVRISALVLPPDSGTRVPASSRRSVTSAASGEAAASPAPPCMPLAYWCRRLLQRLDRV